MNAILWRPPAMILCLALVFHGRAMGNEGGSVMERLGEQVIDAALDLLHAKAGDGELACMTNAGYVKFRNQETGPFFEVLSRRTGIGLENQNLLPVRSRDDSELWFAFLHKGSGKDLCMVCFSITRRRLQVTGPVNIATQTWDALEWLEDEMGEKAFLIVTLANRWAAGGRGNVANVGRSSGGSWSGPRTGSPFVGPCKGHILPRNGE
jgi:formylmethanofuran dehydrogenase subunit E-like metal-binding protein